MLINNAGVAPGNVWEAHDLETVKKLNYLNVNSLTEMTSLFLPYLKKAARHYSSKKRGRHSLTGLLNISSLVGEMPVPFWTQYAATKAYVRTLLKEN